VGTIQSFYDANLNLTQSAPDLNLYNEKWQFFTHPRYLPPSKIEDTRMKDVLIADGTIIKGASLSHSIIGLRSRIESGVTIEDSIIMGCDFYESDSERKKKKIPMGIDKKCVIRKAILDKNVCVGKNVQIVNKNNVEDGEGEHYCIKNGIVIIEKNSVIPSGTII
jgi:glucose-1-phosphate adenylyltransferase